MATSTEFKKFRISKYSHVQPELKDDAFVVSIISIDQRNLGEMTLTLNQYYNLLRILSADDKYSLFKVYENKPTEPIMVSHRQAIGQNGYIQSSGVGYITIAVESDTDSQSIRLAYWQWYSLKLISENIAKEIYYLERTLSKSRDDRSIDEQQNQCNKKRKSNDAGDIPLTEIVPIANKKATNGLEAYKNWMNVKRDIFVSFGRQIILRSSFIC